MAVNLLDWEFVISQYFSELCRRIWGEVLEYPTLQHGVCTIACQCFVEEGRGDRKCIHNLRRIDRAFSWSCWRILNAEIRRPFITTVLCGL